MMANFVFLNLQQSFTFYPSQSFERKLPKQLSFFFRENTRNFYQITQHLACCPRCRCQLHVLFEHSFSPPSRFLSLFQGDHTRAQNRVDSRFDGHHQYGFDNFGLDFFFLRFICMHVTCAVFRAI